MMPTNTQSPPTESRPSLAERKERLRALQAEQLIDANEMVKLGSELRISLPNDADASMVEQFMQTYEFVKQRLPAGMVSIERLSGALVLIASRETRAVRFLRTRLASLGNYP